LHLFFHSPSVIPKTATAPTDKSEVDAKKLIMLLVAWIGAAAWLGSGMMAHDNSPGVTSAIGDSWPQGSAIDYGKGNTILLFVHPKCPCIASSVRMLEQLTAEQEAVHVKILPWRPAGLLPSDTSWAVRTTLPQLPDVEGKEARLFHVRTSGEVLAFNSSCKLIFEGGITASRGGNRNGPGWDRLLEAIHNPGRGGPPLRGRVFGCSLFDGEFQ
jgi:hypothetical protein